MAVSLNETSMGDVTFSLSFLLSSSLV